MIQCNVRDITERKLTRKASEEAEERYRALFEKMRNGYAYCQMLFEGDRPVDFVYLAVNPAFGTLTGLRNVAGRRVTEVIPGIRETAPELFEIYGRVARGGKPERFEHWLQPLDVWLDISGTALERDVLLSSSTILPRTRRRRERCGRAQIVPQRRCAPSPIRWSSAAWRME